PFGSGAGRSGKRIHARPATQTARREGNGSAPRRELRHSPFDAFAPGAVLPARTLVAARAAVVLIARRDDASARAGGVARVALDAAGARAADGRSVPRRRTALPAGAAVGHVGIGVHAASVAGQERSDALEAAHGCRARRDRSDGSRAGVAA